MRRAPRGPPSPPRATDEGKKGRAVGREGGAAGAVEAAAGSWGLGGQARKSEWRTFGNGAVIQLKVGVPVESPAERWIFGKPAADRRAPAKRAQGAPERGGGKCVKLGRVYANRLSGGVTALAAAFRVRPSPRARSFLPPASDGLSRRRRVGGRRPCP